MFVDIEKAVAFIERYGVQKTLGALACFASVIWALREPLTLPGTPL